MEELTDEAVRRNFDVNVFGVLAVQRAVLPLMRSNRSGHIINLASISASVTGPATGIYSATKAAVLMISEALAAEGAEHGIRTTAVCPGGVRTDFLDPSSSRGADDGARSAYSLVRRALSGDASLNHRQGGDPRLVAEAFVRLSRMSDPPARLCLPPHRLRRDLPDQSRDRPPRRALLAKQTDEWAEGHRYLGLDVLVRCRINLVPLRTRLPYRSSSVRRGRPPRHPVEPTSWSALAVRGPPGSYVHTADLLAAP
ncbi:hypothetical protein FHU39_001985 [Flexivirga oryzae]|uniref:SDR family NAD(P)-dependent oxidoreductase n=1 Tax=Flexivirga oryzae TaxID=1794944 RepID=A0A839NBA3_9MICO|nr:hypothetical protein [Flexivirga oryzae]